MLFIGAAGLWAPKHVTVEAAPSPTAPTKKIEPLLKIVFYVVSLNSILWLYWDHLLVSYINSYSLQRVEEEYWFRDELDDRSNAKLRTLSPPSHARC